MFTGIIEAIGHIAQIQPKQGDLQLRIHSATLDMSDVKLGDSIATNGVCLTVVAVQQHGFSADVSRESLAYTNISAWQIGHTVNLEKALLPTSRMGGHMVSGHVDGVGQISHRQLDARSLRLSVSAPESLRKYIAAKGSITIDGVSLTANALTADGFELNIVPHTAEQTTLLHAKVGQQVHLEVDMIARYLEQLVRGESTHPRTSQISQAFLAQNGFWK